MTESQVKESIDLIRKAMDERVGLEDPAGIVTKLEALSSMAGLSAECIAWARKYYDIKLGYLLEDRAYRGYSATDKKILFASKTTEESFLLNYAENLNKDLHYGLESLRTMISYVKQEMQSNLNQR